MNPYLRLYLRLRRRAARTTLIAVGLLLTGLPTAIPGGRWQGAGSAARDSPRPLRFRAPGLEGPGRSAETAARPNIVFIMFDDLGYGSLGSYGSPLIRTPRLDQLAAEGMRFTRFYSTAPVCSPTRAAVLTGQHPARFGIRTITNMGGPPTKGIPADVETLPRLLQAAGYATGHFGKWHLGGRPAKQFHPASKGYDRVVVLREKRYRDPLLRRDYGPFVRRKGHLTALLIDETIGFIEANREQPFFVNLWLLAPHRPLGELPDVLPESYDLSTEEGQFAALVSNADHEVGRLLDSLKRQGLAENTVVLVTSDNGAYRLDGGHRMNAPLRRGKRSVFEGGIRVPLLVRWPGVVKPESIHDSVISSADFAPTLAAIAGATPPEKTDGVSFEDVLHGGRPRHRSRPLIWDYKDPKLAPTATAYAVRDGNWKLVEAAGQRYLFDLAWDSREQNNLAQVEPQVVDRLANRYAVWRRQTAAMPFSVDRTSAAVRVDPQGRRFSFARAGVVALRQHVLFDVSLDDFSFGVWVQPAAESSSGSGPGGAQVLAEKRDSWSLSIAADGRLSLTLWEKHSGRAAVVAHRESLVPGRWHFVAFSLFDDFANRTAVRLFLFAEDGRHGEVSATPVEAVRSTQRRILLGNHAAGKRPFVGVLADPRFFLRALPRSDFEAMARRCFPDEKAGRLLPAAPFPPDDEHCFEPQPR